MRRREFIAGLGSTAAWPLAANGQQPTTPLIGSLSSGFLKLRRDFIQAFRLGLAETGYIEGRNLTIDYKSAEGDDTRLASLAADLVRRQVKVIAGVNSTSAAFAAKAATSTIPIVFAIGGDPVITGLVTSLGRPGGNLTGLAFMSNEVGSKRLQILHELLPSATVIAALHNPLSPQAKFNTDVLLAAAHSLGLTVEVFHATREQDIDEFFSVLVARRMPAFIVLSDTLFSSQRNRIVSLATFHAIPAIFGARIYAEAGGLMSYGYDTVDGFRLSGVYTGRILNGEKPSDLPVLQPTKFELVINLRTAKTLGLTVPETLLATADEVIQ
jgi:putative tryptophan/tyrosine transport system substrate-binding protein